MDRPHCHSSHVSPLQRKTNLGSEMFRCKVCCRPFNERTDTPFNFTEVPTDIIFQALLCRVRYKLSYRDVAEFFLLRGFQFTRATSYPRAIKEELGEGTEHGVRPCTANPVERSHRRIKHRYYPTLGFGEFDAAQRFCRAVDEVGNFLRPQTRMAEFVCLSVGEASPSENRRQKFVKGVEELEALFKAA